MSQFKEEKRSEVSKKSFTHRRIRLTLLWNYLWFWVQLIDDVCPWFQLLSISYITHGFILFHQAIVVQDTFCLRGYWNTPENLSKDQIVEWFKSQIQQLGFLDLKEALYFPQNPGILLKSLHLFLINFFLYSTEGLRSINIKWFLLPSMTL